jgi:hypothetical protein
MTAAATTTKGTGDGGFERRMIFSFETHGNGQSAI